MCFIEKVTAIGRVSAIGYRPAIGCDIYFPKRVFADNSVCLLLKSVGIATLSTKMATLRSTW